MKDLMIAAGIGVDKILALRGEDTPVQQNNKLNVFIRNKLGPATVPEL